MASANNGLTTNLGTGGHGPRSSATGAASPTAVGGRRGHQVPEVRPPDHGAPRRAMWYSCAMRCGPAGTHSPGLRLRPRAG
eukprot:8763997-Alexandrium_andersonii.AAC.1